MPFHGGKDGSIGVYLMLLGYDLRNLKLVLLAGNLISFLFCNRYSFG